MSRKKGLEKVSKVESLETHADLGALLDVSVRDKASPSERAVARFREGYAAAIRESKETDQNA